MMGIRFGLIALVLAVMTQLVTPVSVQAQELVRIRAWQHSDFARIVFDWPAPVGYSASIDGQVLTVRFDRTIQVDLAPVRDQLGDYIASAAPGPGNGDVTFQLTRPMSLGDFTNDNSVVIDLRPAAAPAAAPATAPATPAPAAPETATPEAAAAVVAEAPPGAIALGIRVGDHPGYTRIVFDWPEAPGYSVAQDGRAVTVDFGRAATVDVAALAQRLPPGVQVAAVVPRDGHTLMTFAVPDGAEIKHFPLEEKVVLDVQASASARNVAAAPLSPNQLPQPATPVAQAPEAPASADTAPTADTPTADTPAADAPAADTPPSADAATEPPPAATPEQLAQQAEQRQDQALSNALNDGTLELRRGVAPNLPPPEEAPAPGAQREPIPAPTAAPTADSTAAAQEAPAQQDVAQEGAAQEGDAPEEGAVGPALVTFNFQWSQDVGAAVFRRADNIWIIFDAAAPLELSPLRTEGAPLVERLDQLPIGGATVLRLQVPDRKISASARREGFNWVVDFRSRAQKPQFQAPIRADVTAEVGPHLIFPTDTPGQAMNIPDPEMGDTMRVATFLESGLGIDGLRRYPEFELLPTAQGIAMIRIADSVLLDRFFDGFQISSPDGLAISAVSPEAPVSTGQALSARRLFDLDGWMRGGKDDYVEQEEALFRSLAEVPSEKLDAARLAYAGFMMSHDRGQEALGVLRVVERSNPQLMERPENQALKAASMVLANRNQEAQTLLNDHRLDAYAEVAVWRGAALAAMGEYLDANTAFGPGDSLLNRYPFPLKARLGLLRIETAFANRDVKGAEAWIGVLEQNRDSMEPGQLAALDFDRARLAVAQTDFDEAQTLFNEVIDSGDRKYAYRGELALITLGLRQGFMNEDEALERLERLRYAWRGDRNELHLLRRLGELYLKKPDYFEGLGVYRTAVKYFPGDPVAEDLAGEMVETFRELFLRGAADNLPPLRALALYEEFKELTPAGEDGDELIERIADRLAAIDLLPEAAVKLEELLADEDRLPPGEERVRLSSKLALLYLLDNQPDKAEDALAAGRRGLELYDLDDALEADRDRLLARAKFQKNEYDNAIKELAGDISLEADMLRRDIYRKTENWQESAKVLQRLAGNPPDDPAAGVDIETGRYVINWAVALFQNGDTDGLRDLVDLWGVTMANSELSSVFDYITDQNRTVTDGDLVSAVDRLIGAERFDAFLTTYRDRLFAPVEPPTAEVTASSSS